MSLFILSPETELFKNLLDLHMCVGHVNPVTVHLNNTIFGRNKPGKSQNEGIQCPRMFLQVLRIQTHISDAPKG
jgi:hypothetical protein